MSTLPPQPTYNPNVPVVSSAGGGSAAYKDPNSPESIIKKTATLDAQAKVDSRFDVAEGYKSRKNKNKKGTNSVIILFIFFVLIIYFGWKLVKFTAKVFLGFLAVILLIVILSIYKNG
jgi:hypothetical protein